MITLLAVLFVFGLLIFAHEWGHFIVARRKGVRVDEFAFGFPPKLWSKKKGDTTYLINLIPFGGYVKLYGEHEEDKDNPQSLASKTKAAKAQIIGAGVVMNIILAILLLTIGYAVGMKGFIPGMADHYGVKSTQVVKISEVQKDTPAQKEGLENGDIIRKVDGKPVLLEAEVLAYVTEKTAASPGEKVKLEIERNGQSLEKNLETFEDTIKDSKNKDTKVRRIGVTLASEGNIKAPVYLAPVVATLETYRLTKLTVAGLYGFFEQLFTTFTLSKNVGGPVEIVSLTGSFAKLGFLSLLQFTAILSISLAVINILPIPALDGGHLFFLALEKILGRDLSTKVKNSITLGGFVLLMTLIIALTIRGLLNLR